MKSALIAIGLLAAGPAASTADLAAWSGPYSDVRYIAEADDYVGTNLEILPESLPKVRYELCEGWCNGATVYPATLEYGVLRFTVRDAVFNGDGSPATPFVYRVEVRPIRTIFGRRLLVSSPDLEEMRARLKPVRR
ncbi:MAG: hypothetical protein J0I28_06735 [Caulobacterales bacterium]|nr:hypothetical protein [Caulobacterales bacterium]